MKNDFSKNDFRGEEMKYDLNQKIKRGAQRTLAAFSSAMYELLAKKAYDDISINEICQVSNFPRATFYNYFDDKNDLLNYCWFLLKKESKIEEYQDISDEELQEYLLRQIFKTMYRHQELLTQLSKNNVPGSTIIVNLYEYFKNEAINILRDRLADRKETKLPIELIAEHYSNTILLVLKWIFLEGHPLTQTEAMEYVNRLLLQPEKC